MTRPAWVELARHALHLSRQDQHEAACHVVERIALEHTPEALPEVMCAWVDTFLATRRRPRTDLVELTFVNPDTGVVEDVANLPPAVAWAGRFIAARALDDEQQARALIDSVETDEAWGDCISTVLAMCALNLNAATYSNN